MANVKKGDLVYIEDKDVFGKVERILPDGTIAEVRVKTLNGEEIIKTFNMVVYAAKIIKEALPVFTSIINQIKSWFKKDK